jgi:hypothetical protein
MNSTHLSWRHDRMVSGPRFRSRFVIIEPGVGEVKQLLVEAGAVARRSIYAPCREAEILADCVVLLSLCGRCLEEVIKRSSVTHPREVHVFPSAIVGRVVARNSERIENLVEYGIMQESYPLLLCRDECIRSALAVHETGAKCIYREQDQSRLLEPSVNFGRGCFNHGKRDCRQIRILKFNRRRRETRLT